ncbi:MAG: PQQ-binding-like beta-propeller repeat protein, partial [Pseudomonadota bacterium]|nr:PQQ-binding-like beta-propeller repeat protein [Pseudomonadota bacterium]
MPRVSAVSLIVAAGLSLTACGSSYFGDIEDDLILPGERIPIVLADDDPKADDSLAEKPVALPPPRLNADWPQVGGDAGHAVGHLALDDAPQQVWRRRVGRGSDDRRRLGAPPVVAEGRVFTVDTDGQVAALNMADGHVLCACYLSGHLVAFPINPADGSLQPGRASPLPPGVHGLPGPG